MNISIDIASMAGLRPLTRVVTYSASQVGPDQFYAMACRSYGLGI